MAAAPDPPTCDHGHVALVFQRYTVSCIPGFRRHNRENRLFLLVLSETVICTIMFCTIMICAITLQWIVV